MRKSWPKTVPILEPSDICKGRFSDGAGRHCIYGWVLTVFANAQREKVLDELRAVARRKDIVWFNDTNKSNKIANVWNVAMWNLEYREVVNR